VPGFFFGNFESAWHFKLQESKTTGTLKKRREKQKMPRLPRIYIEGALYYITSRGGINQNIFIDVSDYHEYLSLIDKYKKQYGFKLFSYVLLPTHLHMLVELRNNVGVSKIMHDVNSLYTKIYNNRYAKGGHLFQERFSVTLAEKESHLLQLTRYIHLNPKRLGTVENPSDYPYSSYAQYLDATKRNYPEMRDEVEEAFYILKGREEALAEYTKKATPKETNEIERLLHKKKILGSKAFEENVRSAIEESAKQQKQRQVIPKKAQILYLVLGGAIFFVLTIGIVYLYKQNSGLKNRYNETMTHYSDILEMLRRERNRALTENRNAEEYLWKIRLTEKALQELKSEKKSVIQAGKDIDGCAWKIRLAQIDGPKKDFIDLDTIIFEDNYISSEQLRQEGFSTTRYSKKVLKNGNTGWETIQANGTGETAFWRGEWDGRVMRGVLSRRSSDGAVRDFSFAAVGGKIKQEVLR